MQHKFSSFTIILLLFILALPFITAEKELLETKDYSTGGTIEEEERIFEIRVSLTTETLGLLENEKEPILLQIGDCFELTNTQICFDKRITNTSATISTYNISPEISLGCYLNATEFYSGDERKIILTLQNLGGTAATPFLTQKMPENIIITKSNCIFTKKEFHWETTLNPDEKKICSYTIKGVKEGIGNISTNISCPLPEIKITQPFKTDLTLTPQKPYLGENYSVALNFTAKKNMTLLSIDFKDENPLTKKENIQKKISQKFKENESIQKIKNFRAIKNESAGKITIAYKFKDKNYAVELEYKVPTKNSEFKIIEEIPDKVKKEKPFRIKFKGEPQNPYLKYNNINLEIKEFNISEEEINQEIRITKDKNFEVILTYKDTLGNSYEIKKDYTIKVEETIPPVIIPTLEEKNGSYNLTVTIENKENSTITITIINRLGKDFQKENITLKPYEKKTTFQTNLNLGTNITSNTTIYFENQIINKIKDISIPLPKQIINQTDKIEEKEKKSLWNYIIPLQILILLIIIIAIIIKFKKRKNKSKKVSKTPPIELSKIPKSNIKIKQNNNSNIKQKSIEKPKEIITSKKELRPPKNNEEKLQLLDTEITKLIKQKRIEEALAKEKEIEEIKAKDLRNNQTKQRQ